MEKPVPELDLMPYYNLLTKYTDLSNIPKTDLAANRFKNVAHTTENWIVSRGLKSIKEAKKSIHDQLKVANDKMVEQFASKRGDGLRKTQEQGRGKGIH